MALIEWNSSYSVGVRRFDDQHKGLIDIINRLYDAMLEGKGQAVIEKTLNSLAAYTKVHFRDEEQTMLEYGYPGEPVHKVEHERLTKYVLGLKAELKDNSPATVQKCASLLRDWLVLHIQGSDRKYKDFLNGKGVF